MGTQPLSRQVKENSSQLGRKGFKDAAHSLQTKHSERPGTDKKPDKKLDIMTILYFYKINDQVNLVRDCFQLFSWFL